AIGGVDREDSFGPGRGLGDYGSLGAQKFGCDRSSRRVVIHHQRADPGQLGAAMLRRFAFVGERWWRAEFRGKIEGAARAEFAFDPESAPHQRDQTLDDRQTKSAAAVFSRGR